VPKAAQVNRLSSLSVVVVNADRDSGSCSGNGRGEASEPDLPRQSKCGAGSPAEAANHTSAWSIVEGEAASLSTRPGDD
jgi:hypothetical protein